MGASCKKGTNIAADPELVLALLAAAMPPGAADADLSEDPWTAFLALLARGARAGGAVLRLRRPGRRARQWQTGHIRDDPGEDALGAMRAGRVYSGADLPGGAAGPVRALCWPLEGGGSGLLALYREGDDFRAMAGMQLAGLLPYLPAAVAGRTGQMRQRALAGLDRLAAAGLGAGWILFAPSGQVIAMAPGLAGRLEALAGLRLRADDRLSLSDPEAAQALHQALAAVLAQPGLVRRLDLSRDPPVGAVLCAGEFDDAPVAICHLRHPQSARALPPERIAQVFGLSRSEARLAMALCDGLSLQEAAQDLGWTLETARSCSKRLFARIGEPGQPGVVRRLLQSALWLE